MHNIYSICYKASSGMTNKAKYHETNEPEILADNVSNETVTLSKDGFREVKGIPYTKECSGMYKVTPFLLLPLLKSKCP